MSDWTYIQGSVCLETSPYRQKKNKDGTYKVDKAKHELRFYEGKYLPFGKEQMTISFPKLNNYHEEAVLDYTINLTSYPIIKSYVDKYIQDMPQGELGLFYSLIKDHGVRSSSSFCENKQVEDLFYEHLKEVNKDHIWSDITKKELDKYFPNSISWVEHNTESILTIHDSVRYCVASEMYEALIKFLSNLVKENIELENGVFAFDDYYSKYIVLINNNEITVEIREEDKEPRTEYWQVFTKGHFIRDDESELRKVDTFKDFDERFDFSENEKEMAEYKAKYELDDEM